MVGLRTVHLALLLLLGLLCPVGGESPAGSGPAARGGTGPTLSSPARLEADLGRQACLTAQLFPSASQESTEAGEERPPDAAVPTCGLPLTTSPASWIGPAVAAPSASSTSTRGVARGPPALG